MCNNVKNHFFRRMTRNELLRQASVLCIEISTKFFLLSLWWRSRVVKNRCFTCSFLEEIISNESCSCFVYLRLSAVNISQSRPMASASKKLFLGSLVSTSVLEKNSNQTRKKYFTDVPRTIIETKYYLSVVQ